MAWLAPLPGRLLERVGNGAPRGMVAHDRTRLIDRLPAFFARCVYAARYRTVWHGALSGGVAARPMVWFGLQWISVFGGEMTMRNIRAGKILSALLATTLLSMSMGVHAQKAWLTQAVRLVVPVPAGSSVDIVARLIA